MSSGFEKNFGEAKAPQRLIAAAQGIHRLFDFAEGGSLIIPAAQDEDGDKWLIYNRKKTGTLARVKLLPEALELMAKYEDGARDTLFPLLSTNRVRIDLITICKLAETSKTYSYHSGRHSFASLITLEAGVPMETICKMLGHKDVKMTQRYARVTQKKLFEDMDKFIAATEKDFILAL